MNKVCSKCNIEKNLTEFAIDKTHNDGYSSVCKLCKCINMKSYFLRNMPDIKKRRKDRYLKNKEKECENCKTRRKKYGKKWNENRRNSHKENPARAMFWSAKSRAKRKGLEFNIEQNDLVLPSHCPILGIPLYPSEKRVSYNSPTIDRMDNSKGYVKGNVIVVSFKANTIKNSATLDEIGKVYEFYKKIYE